MAHLLIDNQDLGHNNSKKPEEENYDKDVAFLGLVWLGAFGHVNNELNMELFLHFCLFVCCVSCLSELRMMRLQQDGWV